MSGGAGDAIGVDDGRGSSSQHNRHRRMKTGVQHAIMADTASDDPVRTSMAQFSAQSRRQILKRMHARMANQESPVPPPDIV